MTQYSPMSLININEINLRKRKLNKKKRERRRVVMDTDMQIIMKKNQKLRKKIKRNKKANLGLRSISRKNFLILFKEKKIKIM